MGGDRLTQIIPLSAIFCLANVEMTSVSVKKVCVMESIDIEQFGDGSYFALSFLLRHARRAVATIFNVLTAVSRDGRPVGPSWC